MAVRRHLRRVIDLAPAADIGIGRGLRVTQHGLYLLPAVGRHRLYPGLAAPGAHTLGRGIVAVNDDVEDGAFVVQYQGQVAGRLHQPRGALGVKCA